MFYCEPCRVKNNWLTSICRSGGLCEVCGQHALCYDRPSSSLPMPKQQEQTKVKTYILPELPDPNVDPKTFLAALPDFIAALNRIADDLPKPAPTPYVFDSRRLAIEDANGKLIADVRGEATGQFIVEACNAYGKPPRRSMPPPDQMADIARA